MSDQIFMGLTEYEFFKVELENAHETKTVSQFDKELTIRAKGLGFENASQYLAFILSQHLITKNPDHPWLKKA